MAQLVIAAAGAAVGFAVGGPGGAQIGWAVGSMVGAQFGPKQKSHGPRLEDLKVTGSEYGQTIPWAAGHPRIAGQVWWASQRREISTTTSQGKGGGGAESTTYTYEVDILYGLTNREISAIRRIWLNGKLVWTAHADASASSLAEGEEHAPWGRMTVYTGSAAQLPDPAYDAAVTNAPAYRGRGSVFIESLQLGNSGAIPNLTFEVVVDGQEYLSAPSFGPQQSTPETFANGTPASDSATFVVPIGQWDSYYATTLVNVYSFDAFGGNAQLQSSFNVSVARPTATGTSDVPMMVIAPSTAVRSYEVGGGGASYTMPHFLGEAQLRFARAGADIVFGSTLFGERRLHRCSTAGGSPAVSSAVLGDYVNSILIVGSSVYATTKSSKQMYVLDLATLTLQQTVNLPAYPTVSPDLWPYLFLLRGGVTLVSSSIVDGGYAVYALHGGSTWLKIGNLSLSVVQTANFGATTCAVGNVVIGGLGQSSGGNKYLTWYAPIYIQPNPSELNDVVDDLCAAAGMPAGTYDTTALAGITKPVRAFALSQVATTRSAIEQLMSAYFFEAHVTDKLYFVPRAGSVLDTIDADDMGAGLESPEDETMPTQVGSDLEIPAQVSLSYSNVDADYTTATEHSDRLLSGQVSTSAVQLPLAFTSAEAKGIADAIVVDGYASRVSGSFSVPLAYAELTPTDVVAVPDADGNVYRVRIVRRTDEGPLLRFEWVLDDASAIESAGITSTDYTPTVGVALPGDTLMELLDVPLMRDAENRLGHYVAATSAGATWPGASVSRSLDDVEFAEAARVSERAILGVTTTTLGNWTGGKVFDETNSVTVSLSYGTLSSSTRSAMLADASINAIMIGAELIRFRTATFVSTGVYTLSGLLRGQNGTEWAMAGHTASDRVVLMQSAGMRYVAIDLPSLSAVRYYKGVTLGKSLASVDSEAFTCEGVSLKPLAPVNLRASRMSNGDVLFTWNRRTRVACSFTGAAGIVVPLGEVAEAYRLKIYNDTGLTSLVRSLDTAEQQARYTVADAQADGDVTRSVFYVTVQQIGVVDGYAFSGSFSIPIASSVSVQAATEAGVFGAFDGDLVAMDGGPDGISFIFRTLISADDGATFSESQSGAVATGYQAGVKCWMVASATRRLQFVYNQAAAIRLATYVDDNTSTPTELDPGPTISGANITPYALAVDAVAPFRMLGRPSTATYGAQDFYTYESADGVTWTLVGQVTQDGADPNTLAAGTLGALEALSFSPDYPAYQTASLQRIGSRWFLAGSLGIYYTDDADAQVNWRRCPTGLGEGGSPTTTLGGIVQIGARLLAIRRHTYGSGASVSVSSDDGATWTAYRPNAQGAEELGEMFVHGGDVYISAPTAANPRFLRSSTGLQSSWSVVSGAGIDGALYRFRSSGSNILATNNTTIGGGGVFRIVYSSDGGLNWNVSQIT